MVATLGPNFTFQVEPAPKTEPGARNIPGGDGSLSKETLFLWLVQPPVITVGLKKGIEKRWEGNCLQCAMFIMQVVGLCVIF